MRLARVGPTRPNEPGSNKALYVERWKAVGNLLGHLPLIADELEHVTISVFHRPTILVVADGIGRRAHADVYLVAVRRYGRSLVAHRSTRGHSGPLTSSLGRAATSGFKSAAGILLVRHPDRCPPRCNRRRGWRRQRLAARSTPSGADSPHRRRPRSAPRLSVTSVRDRQRPRRTLPPRRATRPARSGDTWRCSELRARPRTRPPAPAPAWKETLPRPRLAPLRSVPGKPAATARRRDSRGTQRAQEVSRRPVLLCRP
jgi:hypothetical protein